MTSSAETTHAQLLLLRAKTKERSIGLADTPIEMHVMTELGVASARVLLKKVATSTAANKDPK